MSDTHRYVSGEYSAIKFYFKKINCLIHFRYIRIHEGCDGGKLIRAGYLMFLLYIWDIHNWLSNSVLFLDILYM